MKKCSYSGYTSSEGFIGPCLPDMTYNVFSGTLNRAQQTIGLCLFVCFIPMLMGEESEEVLSKST